MKSMLRFSLFKVLVLAIAALGVSAVPAHAQMTTGTFSLAHKVRWSDAVLPAGSYAFSLDSQSWPVRVTVRQLDGPMVALFVPQTTSEEKVGGPSTLLLRQENGESVVSTLRLPSIGKALQFASPKLVMPVAETAGLAPIAGPQPAR